MSKWENIRAWINKNDGSFYQIDNQNLTLLEVVGYLLCIAALVIYLLRDKTGLKETWFGWLFLLLGFLLIIVGVLKRTANEKNT